MIFKSSFITILLLGLTAASIASATGPTTPTAAAAPSSVKSSTGHAIIPGTWEWDIENNAIASCTPDFWWERFDEKEARLVPVPGVKVALLEDKDYDSVDYAFLKKFEFPEKNPDLINRGDTLTLRQGAVLAVRTTQGHLAKVQIRSYHRSDDQALGEPVLEPLVKILSQKNPPLKNFHMEVAWTLYDSPNSPPEHLTVGSANCGSGKSPGAPSRTASGRSSASTGGTQAPPAANIDAPTTKNYGGADLVHF